AVWVRLGDGRRGAVEGRAGICVGEGFTGVAAGAVEGGVRHGSDPLGGGELVGVRGRAIADAAAAGAGHRGGGLRKTLRVLVEVPELFARLGDLVGQIVDDFREALRGIALLLFLQPSEPTAEIADGPGETFPPVAQVLDLVRAQ